MMMIQKTFIEVLFQDSPSNQMKSNEYFTENKKHVKLNFLIYKPKGLKVAKEDLRSIGSMVDRLDVNGR